MDAVLTKSIVVSLSLKDAPALIERVWPAQKISVETKREFDAHGAQTLTPLGSYWKGRKRLVYVRACVLGSLLPATGDPERDLAVFEKLMALDDLSFLARERKAKPSEIAQLAIEAGALTDDELPAFFAVRGIDEPRAIDFPHAMATGRLVWNCDKEDRDRLRLAAYSRWTYEEKVSRSLRPEELSDADYENCWDYVNAHLKTSAQSIFELVEQLGIMRFGRRARVADTFCGAGSIPFEAARIGCDVYASDLNPIACMLTWGALHLIGGPPERQAALKATQMEVANAVDDRIKKLGIEHDGDGNRAKAYLYCVEVRCPRTEWRVPLLPSLVVSRIKKTIGRLVPNRVEKRIDIVIEGPVSDAELEAAKLGTYRNKSLHYELDGEVYATPISVIRGDFRASDGCVGNRLRPWEKDDIIPHADDVFGERLYCIQWIKAETLGKGRQENFFRTPDEEDHRREQKVTDIVRRELVNWQQAGFVPEMRIEPGEKTDEPIRTRGWTYWHHLFTPRQLLIDALAAEEISKVDDQDFLQAGLTFDRTFLADKSSRLSHWRIGSPGKHGRAPSADGVEQVFQNQALNTFYNFGARGFWALEIGENVSYKNYQIRVESRIETHECREVRVEADIWITDPPYADAINYHEISEFFIAWLRKNPARPFREWIWDSRRALAIRGSGDEFKKAMAEAYATMADHMPDNGLQIVMFTHQDAGVWADMAQIFWGAGLQVVAAWYVATETTSAAKKGGYVQGTVTIVLRKRKAKESGYKDEIVQEVKLEVADQIDTMSGLNQTLKGHGRIENLFEDADLQMAGYAAALRVLTRYARIDGVDMAKEALRPEAKGEMGLVAEIIEFAVQVANEHMVPDGMSPSVWEHLTGAERFFFKMMDIETTGARKLDNYQNFAKAFRVADYGQMMGSTEPNKACLKSAKQFKKSGFEGSEFGASKSRALLYAVLEVENEVDGEDVLSHLHDLIPGYLNVREDLIALADYVAKKREGIDEAESRAARILYGLIRNERFG